jgi:hypothetical protein
MKRILLIFALLIFSTNSHAQEGVNVSGNTISIKEIAPVGQAVRKVIFLLMIDLISNLLSTSNRTLNIRKRLMVKSYVENL